MRSCIKIFVIAMVPVLLAGVVQAAETKLTVEERLAAPKAELEKVSKQYYASKSAPYAEIYSIGKLLNKKSAAMIKANKVTKEDLAELSALLEGLQGKKMGWGAWVKSWVTSGEDTFLGSIAKLWDLLKEEKLTDKGGSQVYIIYEIPLQGEENREGFNLKEISEGVEEARKKNPAHFTFSIRESKIDGNWYRTLIAQNFADFKELIDLAKVNPFDKNSEKEFFKSLPNVDFAYSIKKFLDDKGYVIADDVLPFQKIKKGLETIISELERAGEQDIINLASTLKLIA